MNGNLPEVITLKSECSTHFRYDNHPIVISMTMLFGLPL
jgi:hypothetical protein